MQTLTADLLDDVFLAQHPQISNACEVLRTVSVQQIGPLLEYVWQRERVRRELPSVDELPRSGCIEALESLDRRRTWLPLSTSLRALPVEFSRTPRTDDETQDRYWDAFSKRAEHAARESGFTKTDGQRLVAALREMADNAREHSESPESAICGYQWVRGEYEFVVGDMGVGVLQSLRTAPEFSHLKDHGDALLFAVQSRVSRFGAASNRGYGFDNLFRKLAHLRGNVRLRSGDQAATIDGQSLSVSNLECSQRTYFTGFMVTVRCRPN